jgi:4-amino-4-deoxy-L-arabinose transferase-like glycosyltransferase
MILDTLFTVSVRRRRATDSAVLRDRRRLQWAGYACLAVATFVKGPLALVLCRLTLLVASVWSADARRRLLGLNWMLGLLLILALASPWFVYMYLRFGDAFMQGYVLDENLRLYGSSRFTNQPGPWFYVQILIVGLLPWTGVLIGRLVDDVRAARSGQRLDTVEILLWSWALAILIFFSLSTFKLDHYIFPVAPALCLLCARAWTAVRADATALRHAGARRGLQMIGPLLVVVGAGAAVFLIARLELPRAAVIVPVVVTLAGALLMARANIRRTFPPAMLWIVMIAMTVTYAGVVGFRFGAEQRKVVPDVARWVAGRAMTGRVAMRPEPLGARVSVLCRPAHHVPDRCWRPRRSSTSPTRSIAQ